MADTLQWQRVERGAAECSGAEGGGEGAGGASAALEEVRVPGQEGWVMLRARARARTAPAAVQARLWDLAGRCEWDAALVESASLQQLSPDHALVRLAYHHAPAQAPALPLSARPRCARPRRRPAGAHSRGFVSAGRGVLWAQTQADFALLHSRHALKLPGGEAARATPAPFKPCLPPVPLPERRALTVRGVAAGADGAAAERRAPPGASSPFPPPSPNFCAQSLR